MMTMTQVQFPVSRQRQLAQLWRAGMILLMIGIVSNSLGQVWDGLISHGGWHGSQLDWLGLLALAGGTLGFGLTLYTAFQFQKGPLPRFVVYGTARNMDERDVARLLDAQARAQQLFARCLLGLVLTGGAWGRDGLHLSWWSCLLGLALLLNAVIYLPISILAANERDLEAER